MDRTIDATKARQNFGTLLDEVFYKKDRIIIERKGKALAQLIPINTNGNDDNIASEKDQQRKKLLDELSALPSISMDKNPTEVLRQLRSQRKKQARQSYGK